MTTDATPATPRLSARDVVMRFGGITALDGVSLDVLPGQVTGLIGPNGAGKSTLFAILSGLLRPTAGAVLLDGRDVTHTRQQVRARAGLARTFQHPELFAGLTVREHLMLAHRLTHERGRLWRDLLDGRGLRKPAAAETERVDGLLDSLGLLDAGNRPVAGLPLGTSRLVEVGRALALSPSVVLLDEPTSGLDVTETEELAHILRRVVEVRGASLLFVEHDVDLVLRMCSQVYVLDFGRCIAAGTPAEIRDNAAVRAAYLGQEVAA